MSWEENPNLLSVIKPERRVPFRMDFRYAVSLAKEVRPELANLPGFEEWVLASMAVDEIDKNGGTQPFDTDRLREICNEWYQHSMEFLGALGEKLQ